MTVSLWDIAEAKQERYRLWEQAKALNEKAAAEKRELTTEEKQSWDKMDADLTRMTETIQRQERLLAVKDAQQTAESTRDGVKPQGNTQQNEGAPDEEYNKAFRSWLIGGNESLLPEQRAAMQKRFVTPDTRNLGVGSGAIGGFLVPQGFYDEIDAALRAYGGIRNSRAKILPTASGLALPIPTTDDTSNVGVIVAENTQITDLATTYGQRLLGAHMYSSRIVRVSLQLLQDSAFNIQTHLAGILGERIARITNAHFTIGTGSGQPQGVNTAATTGITATAGSATTITYPNIVAMQHSLDPAYRTSAEWMFHDTTLRALKQMVDGQQRPLWLPGLATREPDTILGHRYVINQDMPVMAANARSILFGDFSRFFVRDVQDMQIMRLTERYADFLQVGFLAFSRHDCVLTDTAAVRVYINSAT